MRVSSKTYQLQWLSSFNQRQFELADVQRQVSTGRRVATAADDPSGAAQMILLQQGLDRLAGYQANAETARRRLSLAESALDDATGALDRVRELMIQAGGATQTPETRAALANEAREVLKTLVDVANSQDGEGRYLFAGNRVDTLPFVATGGDVQYQGDAGSRAQRIGDNRVIEEGDPGSRVFAAIRNGNGVFSVAPAGSNAGTSVFSQAVVTDRSAWVPDTYQVVFTAPDSYEVQDSSGTAVASGSFTPGDTITFNGVGVTIDGEPATGDAYTVTPSVNQDVFQTVQNFIDLMDKGLFSPAGRAQVTSGLNAGLSDIDQALTNLNTVRGTLGARLSVIDQQAQNNAELDQQYTQTLSQIRDVDYATAISELEQQLLGLEAAQRTFARTRTTSLFQLI